LEGLGFRYTGEESLIGLGLIVVEQSKKGFKYFKVNPEIIDEVRNIKAMFSDKKVFTVEIG
ncbi:MAG: archaellum operon transcriptional activator EarA family protein, partial [Thermoplasmata archaeon]